MKIFGFIKSKTNELKSKLAEKISTAKTKFVVATAVFNMSVVNYCYADGDFNPSGAIQKMASYATAVISGVGVIYGIVAVFNWVSAIKQEDSERASKAIVNVFIAGLLICIWPITKAILTAFGGDGVAGLD